MEIFEYLEYKAQKVIDSSLTPHECLSALDQLSGAVDVLIKCGFLTERLDIEKAFDIVDQVQRLAIDSLDDRLL